MSLDNVKTGAKPATSSAASGSTSVNWKKEVTSIGARVVTGGSVTVNAVTVASRRVLVADYGCSVFWGY